MDVASYLLFPWNNDDNCLHAGVGVDSFHYSKPKTSPETNERGRWFCLRTSYWRQSHRESCRSCFARARLENHPELYGTRRSRQLTLWAGCEGVCMVACSVQFAEFELCIAVVYSFVCFVSLQHTLLPFFLLKAWLYSACLAAFQLSITPEVTQSNFSSLHVEHTGWMSLNPRWVQVTHPLRTGAIYLWILLTTRVKFLSR